MGPKKAYRGTVRFGVTTTTDDLEGEIITSKPAPDLTLAEIERVLPNFLGTIEQVPPSYSAIKVEGKKLYDLARQGKTVEVPTRTVEVYGVEVLEFRAGEFPEVDLAIACGGGTYIRAIARDLGAVLDTGGTLAALTRTESNGFSLNDSLTFEEMEIQLQEKTFSLLSPEVALAHLPAIDLVAEDAKKWCQGQRLSLPRVEKIEEYKVELPLRVYILEGEFLGIGKLIQSETDLFLTPQIVLGN